MSRYRLLAAVTAVVLLADQASKLYIDRHFFPGESLIVWKHFFNITYVRNQGAAFGMLANSPLRLPFFIVVALAAVVGVLPCMRQATVAPLYGNGGFAVRAAVPKQLLPQVIPAVKAAGATDVVVSSLSQIVP